MLRAVLQFEIESHRGSREAVAAHAIGRRGKRAIHADAGEFAGDRAHDGLFGARLHRLGHVPAIGALLETCGRPAALYRQCSDVCGCDCIRRLGIRGIVFGGFAPISPVLSVGLVCFRS